MCEICGYSRCSSRCPNAQEPAEIYKCKICGDGVTDGESYYEMDGEYYHEECFEDNAAKILVEECGAIKGIARLEE